MGQVYRRPLVQHRKKGVKPVETTEEPFLLLEVVENFAIQQRFLELTNISLGDLVALEE